MSRARHKAAGGRMSDKSSQSCDANFADGGEVYAGAGSNVVKEAMAKRKGGSVGAGLGGKALAKGVRTGSLEDGPEARKRGGRVTKEVGMPGGKMMKRGDKRPRKAGGGRIGSDKAPYSSAARPAQNTETSEP